MSKIILAIWREAVAWTRLCQLEHGNAPGLQSQFQESVWVVLQTGPLSRYRSVIDQPSDDDEQVIRRLSSKGETKFVRTISSNVFASPTLSSIAWLSRAHFGHVDTSADVVRTRTLLGGKFLRAYICW